MKAIVPICIFVLFVAGCIKTPKDEHYSIKGKMLKDCNGTPLALYGLTLHYKASLFDDKNDRDWTTTTDLQGNFTFPNIPGNYRGNLYLYSQDHQPWGGNFDTPFGAIDGQTIDLGTFYEEFKMFTVARFNVNTNSFSPSDTLYIGGVTDDFQYYYPVPVSVIVSDSELSLNSGIGQGNPKGWGFVWGRNKRDFDSARLNANMAYHLVYSKIGICTLPDTTFLSIP
jgi:hypothetical protein